MTLSFNYVILLSRTARELYSGWKRNDLTSLKEISLLEQEFSTERHCLSLNSAVNQASESPWPTFHVGSGVDRTSQGLPWWMKVPEANVLCDRWILTYFLIFTVNPDAHFQM